MRPVRTRLAVIATLVTVGVLTAGIAGAQPGTGESYWGEHTLNGILHTWPAVAIAVLAALVVGRLLGFYEMGAATTLLVLAAIAFLVYQFYWRPVPPVSSQVLRHAGPRQALAVGRRVIAR